MLGNSSTIIAVIRVTMVVMMVTVMGMTVTDRYSECGGHPARARRRRRRRDRFRRGQIFGRRRVSAHALGGYIARHHAGEPVVTPASSCDFWAPNAAIPPRSLLAAFTTRILFVPSRQWDYPCTIEARRSIERSLVDPIHP
jgi:hypothetical protein